jgi:hypothetical protein
MFLFRRKKDNTEAKLAAQEAKVKKALEQKEKEAQAIARKEAAAAKAAQVEAAKKEAAAARVVKVEAVKAGKAASVKVVVPAGSLKEEGSGLPKVQSQAPAGAEVPDELVDSLLVKVNREGSDEIAAPALSEIIPAAKPVQAVVETPAAATGANQSPVAAEVAQSAAKPVAAVVPPSAAQPAPATDAAKAEAKPVEAPKKPAAEAKKGATEDNGNMFSNLFGKSEVEEETYLDRLIKSLPDITIEEVMSEADEVKGLMSEWSQSQIQR